MLDSCGNINPNEVSEDGLAITIVAGNRIEVDGKPGIPRLGASPMVQIVSPLVRLRQCSSIGSQSSIHDLFDLYLRVNSLFPNNIHFLSVLISVNRRIIENRYPVVISLL